MAVVRACSTLDPDYPLVLDRGSFHLAWSRRQRTHQARTHQARPAKRAPAKPRTHQARARASHYRSRRGLYRRSV